MTKNISLIIDFDDTLVESNTAREVLREFIPNEYDELAEMYRSKKVNFKNYQELSFKKAFKKTSPKNIEKSSIKNSKIRKGFENLVTYCENNDVKIYILSSGLELYIKPVLKKYESKLNIIAANVNFNKNNHTSFEYKSSYDDICSLDWGICKCKTVESLSNNNFIIYVGDGITTDLCASIKCDEIFALTPLYNSLLEKKIIVNKFEDFNQLEKHVNKLQRKNY